MHREVNLNFRFIIPVETVLDNARRLSESADADERAVGKAVVEVTRIIAESSRAQGVDVLGAFTTHEHES